MSPEKVGDGSGGIREESVSGVDGNGSELEEANMPGGYYDVLGRPYTPLSQTEWGRVQSQSLDEITKESDTHENNN